MEYKSGGGGEGGEQVGQVTAAGGKVSEKGGGRRGVVG